MANRKYTVHEKFIINHVKSIRPHVCYYCSKELKNNNLTVDHKIPFSRGGITNEENLVICCKKCNYEKAEMTENEYYLYKRNIKDMENRFEVNQSIQELLTVQNNIFNRAEQVANELNKLEREMFFLQKDLKFDNFNACEGYLYAKKIKELLIKKDELSLIKEQYNNLNKILNIHNQQTVSVAEKISKQVKMSIKSEVKDERIKQQLVKEYTYENHKQRINIMSQIENKYDRIENDELHKKLTCYKNIKVS